jgi:hypothetical protein
MKNGEGMVFKKIHRKADKLKVKKAKQSTN